MVVNAAASRAELQRGLERARGRSISPREQFKEAAATARGGGGGRSAPAPTDIKAEENRKKDEQRKKIDKEQQKKRADLEAEFRKNTLRVDRNTRINLTKQLREDLQSLKNQTSARKLQAGLITSFTPVGTSKRVSSVADTSQFVKRGEKDNGIRGTVGTGVISKVDRTLQIKRLFGDVKKTFTGSGLTAEELGIDKKFRDTKGPVFVETGDITTDVTPFKGSISGKGTATFTRREKTFFEKFGLNPNDKDAINLKRDIESIREDFSSGRLNDIQADKRLNKITDDFTKKQILKGIPGNIAAGVALGLIQRVPVVGQLVGGAVLGDFFLRRNKIREQFENFPLESGLATASFLAGGLAGNKIGAGIKGSVADIKIEPNKIDSVAFIKGTEKVKLRDAALEFFPEVKASVKQNKVTDTISYEVKLKNGKVFKIVEFTKSINGKVSKEFIGFESGVAIPGKPEVFVGRGIGKITGKGEFNFIRAVKFKQANTKVGRFVQKKLGSGKIIDLIEKSTLESLKTRRPKVGTTTKFIKLKTVSQVIETKRAKGKFISGISKLIKDLEEGKPISPMRIRNMINLQRRLKGKKPVGRLDIAQVSNVELISLLKRLKGSVKITSEGTRRTFTQKDVFFGGAKTRAAKLSERLIKIKKKGEKLRLRKKSKLPLFREAPIIGRSKKIAKQDKPFSKLKQVQKTKEILVTSSSFAKSNFPSPSISATGLIAGIPASGGKLSFPTLGFRSTAVGIEFTGLINNPIVIDRNINALKNQDRLISLEKIRLLSLVDSKLDLSNLQRTKLESLNRQREVLKTKQEILQKTKQQVKQKIQQVSRGKQIGQSKARARLKPPITLIGAGDFFRKKKVVKKTVPATTQKGYIAFAKQRGKFVRISKVPVSKTVARNQSAFFTDKTLSATGIIKKTTKSARKPKIKVPRAYFDKQIGKFRVFKIVKGKRVPTPNQIIEKRKFRLDAKNERQTIQQLKRRLLRRKKK